MCSCYVDRCVQAWLMVVFCYVNICVSAWLTVVFQPGWQLFNSQLNICVPAMLTVVFKPGWWLCFAMLTVVFQPGWQVCSSQVDLYSSVVDRFVLLCWKLCSSLVDGCVPARLTAVFQPGWQLGNQNNSYSLTTQQPIMINNVIGVNNGPIIAIARRSENTQICRYIWRRVGHPEAGVWP